LGVEESGDRADEVDVHSVFIKPRIVALAAIVGVLALTAALDGFARSAQRAEIRADTSARLDGLARTMSDLIARETAAADTMAVFVEVTGYEPQSLEHTFPVFADALMRERPTIRSVQLAPDNILDFVYPLEGNEAAVGLDLLDDPERRANLLPAIERRITVMQGPFELVQGGQALAVRHPVFWPDGSFWGFAAVVLDWPQVTDATGFDALPSTFTAGVRLPGDDRVIAGNPAAFEGDPLTRTIAVGATETIWTMAMRPSGGWPDTADVTGWIWLFGVVVASLGAVISHTAVKRPELLERERVAALAELARSEATFQATFLHAGVGIVIGDISGRVVTANPAFAEIVGRSGEDLRGEELLGYLAEEHRRTFEREMIGAYRRGTLVNLDVRLAGSIDARWGRIRVTTIPGEERLFVGIVEDITDRLAAELALGESEDRFRRLFEHAPIAIQREDHSAAKAEVDDLLAGDVDIRTWFEEDETRLRDLLTRVVITDLNPAAHTLQARLGIGLGGGPMDRHYTATARDGFIRTLEAMARNSTTLEYEIVTDTVHGELVHLDMKWQVPTIDGTPDYSNVMLTLHDSTELRDTERRLQEEIESKDRFIASVAHELRTPLTAVVGFAHELLDDSGVHGDDERKEFQHLIAFHSGELAHLIEDLLVWARADIGEVQVKPAMIDLGACVAQCIEAMPGADMPIDWTSQRIAAFSDASRVRQIVRNLVTNAARYGGPDARVSIRVEGDWSVVEVSDDGDELPTAQREAIFAPYSRVDGSPSLPGSIGLGLTVSRTLARLQGGELLYVRENGRNVFRLTLPGAPEVEPAYPGLEAVGRD
jgi:two-component system, sensor histidine kinase and response regulator